ncbi:MAG TPA: YisL family protein [Bacillota bacterium]|nr:YisL family protein [Bacillota bacterium]
MPHMHITSWVLAFILLVLVIMFHRQGKEKASKIVHMILRLDFLFILYTGGSLFSNYIDSDMLPEAIVKVVAGLWAIIAMEMIALKVKKDLPSRSWMIQLIIAAVIAIALGFGRLPMGVLP